METENSKSKEGLIQSQIVMSYILQGPISKFRSAGKSVKNLLKLSYTILQDFIPACGTGPY